MTSLWGSHDREADEDRFTVSVEPGAADLPPDPDAREDYVTAVEALRVDATEVNEYVHRLFPGESYHALVWRSVILLYDLDYESRHVAVRFVRHMP